MSLLSEILARQWHLPRSLTRAIFRQRDLRVPIDDGCPSSRPLRPKEPATRPSGRDDASPARRGREGWRSNLSTGRWPGAPRPVVMPLHLFGSLRVLDFGAPRP